MIKIDTLLVGATCFSIGYALKNKDCLIIEKGVWACSDYSGCLNASAISNPVTAEGKELLNDLTERRLVDKQGLVHILPVADKMCDLILKNGINVRFETEFIKATKTDNGYDVKVFGVNGFETVFCNEIIYTIPKNADGYSKKYYCATVQLSGEVNSDYIVKETLNGNIIKRFVDINDDYPKARKIILDTVEKYDGKIQIYAFADDFGYEYEKPIITEINKGYKYIPSMSFGNFLSAFDNGVLLRRKDYEG